VLDFLAAGADQPDARALQRLVPQLLRRRQHQPDGGGIVVGAGGERRAVGLDAQGH
jgi:hypothetical protein